ncbi:MurR/RpiR family transcriptional regulator [Rhizobium mesoamericanum]|uniref:MurR/RpiR family transcriptional regulator n=1 Tax=Rhizobium mesoamericanum TaxID=1079800 RepID=UPI0003F5FB75|nr:MurR/RpiR family transcriptional regulator [Rhizobium mesoamericanum]
MTEISARRTAPHNYHHLNQLIASGQLEFPDQLRQVARFALAHPEIVAFESSKTLATLCGVSPTSVSRFVRHVGFKDFREMKVLFQSRLREMGNGRPDGIFLGIVNCRRVRGNHSKNSW